MKDLGRWSEGRRGEEIYMVFKYMCRGGPSLWHLLFVGNCFLFFTVDLRESTCIKDISVYLCKGIRAGNQFSQVWNLFQQKCFSQATKTEVMSNIGIMEVFGTRKYLGLPSTIGGKKKVVFNYLKARIWKKISVWSVKHLSRVGCEVLVKVVAQAIPAFYISAFLLPVSLCDGI